ncbi:MAG: hypothetical protein FI711_06630 [SAR202 cluster bacterium]|nr:hypothetical protein [SAR202 cluster bacterium]
MGCLTSLLRAGAGLVLGVVIFVGFLFVLILNNFSDKLLSADFYMSTIAAEDTYDRIYNEVLVDDELKDRTQELLGDIKVVEHQEIVDLLEEIMPPAYIKGQVEASIDRTIDYINEDVDRLEVYVELAEPLENVKTVMFAYMDAKIDGLRVEETQGFGGCTPSSLGGLAERYVDTFSGLSEGVVPESIPSIKEISAPCRIILFELVFGSLVDDSGLSDDAKQSLNDGKGELRLPFAMGDTLEVLKVSTRLLAGPLMDDAIESVRADLDENGRFDLIRQLAEWDDDTTEAEIRQDIDDGRVWISRANNFGDLTSLILVIGGAVLMGLVFFPTFSSMLRWPGVALLITGAFFFAAGKIAESEVPDRLTYVIESGADKVSEVPPSVTDLGGDILISFGSQLTDGFAGPSITLLVIGAVLLGSSFFTIVIKRFIPIVK